MSPRRYLFITLVLLSVALATRVGVAIWWQDQLAASGQRFAMGDSESYWVLAHQIANGEPYQYGSPDAAVFRTPLYPWLLSWVVDPQERVVDPQAGILAARVMGCVFGTLAVALMMWTTKRHFGSAASIVAGVLVTFYPGGIISSVLVLSEAPFMPLMLMVLVCLTNLQSAIGKGIKPSISAGVLSGLAVLARPSWLLFPPFYFLLQLVFSKQRLRYFLLAIVTGIFVALTMLPWWIRNYQVTGHFVLTTLQVGASLYDGLHPNATGGSDSGMQFVLEFGEQLRAEDALQTIPPSGFEYRLNQRLSEAAILWASENPGRAFQLSGLKIARTWWPWPAVTELPGGMVSRALFALSTCSILIPGLFFVVRRRSWNTDLVPFLVPMVYFTCLHAVFVGSIRYREPALFAFSLFAAPQYMDWFQQLRKAGKRDDLLRINRGNATATP